jgi:hypothetical protein
MFTASRECPSPRDQLRHRAIRKPVDDAVRLPAPLEHNGSALLVKSTRRDLNQKGGRSDRQGRRRETRPRSSFSASPIGTACRLRRFASPRQLREKYSVAELEPARTTRGDRQRGDLESATTGRAPHLLLVTWRTATAREASSAVPKGARFLLSASPPSA